MMDDLDFLRRLKHLRLRAGLTQTEIDIRCGFYTGTYAQFEAGSRAPGLKNIKALIAELACDPSELLGDPRIVT